MPRIGDDVDKQQIAVSRRAANELVDLDVQNDHRSCFNCNQSINNEIRLIRENPTHLRLNVLNQKGERACFICNAPDEVRRVSLEARLNVFVLRNIYVPEDVRCCEHHFDHDGFILQPLILGLRFTNRPYAISGPELQTFLEHLRNLALANPRLTNADSLTDEEFSCLYPLNKPQFEDLLTYCEAVQDANAAGEFFRRISRKDLMAFLCKMRQGVSDEFLKVVYNYNTRQAVSMAMNTVRKSLTQRFVSENIGVQAIGRENFIALHVSGFANTLFSEEPDVPKAIVLCDGTYSYIHKSSNFQVLRQSYSLHKGRHLLKPTLIVGTDGYILAILGPYFSDARNNDAAILRAEFDRDGAALRNWFQDGDIFIVDRGYRDVIPFLETLGISHKMPAFLQRRERQFDAEVANTNRLITKIRWIVEARNGHLKSIFKHLGNTFNIQNARHLGDDYRICGAIINKYHPLIIMENATVEVARTMLQRVNTLNEIRARVEVDNLRRRNAQWQRLEQQAPDFPALDLEYLEALTFGVYQVNLARSYIQDQLNRDGDDELQIDEALNEETFIRVRLYSRFRRDTNHQVFIKYNDDGEFGDNVGPITGYYCTCQVGSRTLGSCAHVASVLWYLGYARHRPEINYPDGTLLQTTRNAAQAPDADDLLQVEMVI